MAESVGTQIGKAIVAYLPTQSYRDLAVTAENIVWRNADQEEVSDNQALAVIVQEMAAESDNAQARASYYQKTYTMRVRIQETMDAEQPTQADRLKVLAEDIERNLFRTRQPQAGVHIIGVLTPGEAEGFDLDSQQTRRMRRLNVEAMYRHILKA